MSELLSEETRLAIQHLIIKCANDAKQQADNFAKNETSIGRQHPKGLSTHITEVIFEQKKELKKGSMLGSRWINSNCPDVFTKDVISHIIELATDYFIKEKEDDIHGLQKEWIKEIRTDMKILESLEKHYLSSFFKGIRRVYALEDLVNKEVQRQTLWDCFTYKEDVEKIKQILISENRLAINENEKPTFIPIRKSTSYEPFSLFYALENLKFLNVKLDIPQLEVLRIIANTFNNCECEIQMVAKGRDHKITANYRNICKDK